MVCRCEMTKKISILDYGIGNIFNLTKAFESCGAEVELIDNPSDIINSEKLILPGVGAFAKAMEELGNKKFIDPVKEFASTGKPLLGICLGAQMLFSESYEFGLHKGLDLVKGKVVKIRDIDEKGKDYKVPYISWSELHKPQNNINWEKTILKGIREGTTAYFIHSFTFVPENIEHRLADTFYDNVRLCAAVKHENIYGTQFHPERSGKFGLQILENFINL